MDTQSHSRGNNIRNIRRYVMRLLYQNSFTSVKVPSASELAKQFGVVRRTARMALEGLIAEGYLIGRVGIGTFTNPSRGFKAGRTPQLPLVAVGMEDCAQYYFDTRIGYNYTSLMNAVLRNGDNLYPLIHSASDFDNFCDELRGICANGLILHTPQRTEEQMRHIRALGMPIVTIRQQYDGCSAILFDEEASGKILARTLAKTLPQTADVLYCYHTATEYERIVMLALKGLSRHTISCSCIPNWNHEFEERLRERLAAGKVPSLLVIGWLYLWLVEKLFVEFNIDPVHQCRVLVLGAPPSINNTLPCWGFCQDTELQSDLAIHELHRLMGDHGVETQTLFAPWKLTAYNL